MHPLHLAISELRRKLGRFAFRKAPWGCSGGCFSIMASSQGESMDVQQELKLIESDIPGAELPKLAEPSCYSQFI